MLAEVYGSANEANVYSLGKPVVIGAVEDVVAADWGEPEFLGSLVAAGGSWWLYCKFRHFQVCGCCRKRVLSKAERTLEQL